MTAGGSNWESDFPMRDEVEDFLGRKRVFLISCYDGPLGFTVQAEEEGADGNGYLFRAFSETSPYSALYRLRVKMHRAIATRYLSASPGAHSMLHDRVRGRITTDGDRGVLLVVDGIPLDMDELANILETHEGWEFELRIRDALK